MAAPHAMLIDPQFSFSTKMQAVREKSRAYKAEEQSQTFFQPQHTQAKEKTPCLKSLYYNDSKHLFTTLH